MSDEKRVSPRGSRPKEDQELNYDSIASGDVPVDRHDIVVPGDTARYLEQPDFASAPPPKEAGDLGRRATDDPEVGKDAAADAQLQAGTQGARNFEDDGAGRRWSGDSEDRGAGGRSGQGEGLTGLETAEGDLGPFTPGQGSPRPFLETLEDESGGGPVDGLRNGAGQGGLVDGLLNTVTGLVDDVVDTVTEIVPTVLDAVGLSVSESSVLGTVVATLSATGTNAGTVVYSLLNDPSGNFIIAGDKILISPTANLDYETATSHDITVRGVDAAGDIVTQTFTIEITDADEFNVTAVADADAAADIVSEDASAGDTIGVVASAADGDGTDTVTFAVDDPRFTVDADGTVRVADGASFDAETEPSITINVTATSTDGSTSNQSFTVAVGDVNESSIGAVSDTDAGGNSVTENAAVGTTVGITAFASDADAGDTVTYSLSDDAGGLFAIDANTGVVTVAGAIDREAAASHDIEVTATSTDGSTSTQAYTISVNDQSEFSVTAPSDSDAAANAVTENAAVGTTVGITALASDGDATNNTITYTLSDNAGGLFAIDPNTGAVTVAGVIDREVAASYDIEVTASSSDGSSQAQTFTIAVNDVDEFNISATTDGDGAANQVSEAAAVGSAVGVTALATDADATDSVTYSLSSNLGGFFAIDANTGVVTVANALDYETGTQHTIEVTSTSSDGSTSTQSFTIDVMDANESGVGAVSDNDGTANAVNENAAAGTAVGITAAAADADGSDTVTYSLSNDAGGLFAIDANTGVVTVAGAIDREAAASYDIEVTATSSDGSTSTQAYTINVNDIDEFDVSTPADANAAANVVAENAANGTVVGVTASAADGDATNNGVTYSLVDGSGNPVAGGPFAVDANSGVVTVADGAQLDYETATSHTIYVKATSADGSESTESFVINVTDQNESGIGAISDNDGSANAVNENSAIGTTVGITAAAADADGSDTVTYALSDDAGGLFAIDANTGVVTVAGAIDREAAASYDIEVTATSSDGSTSTQAYTINVNDIDEFDVSTPTDSNAASNTVAENAANGTVVGVTASAADGDATNNGVTYSLVDGSGNPVAGGPFAVDANSGVVTVADNSQLDYETATSQTIYVKATSADGSTSTESFIIAVTNVYDEGPTDITYTGGSVNETVSSGGTVGSAHDPSGDTVATLSATDADSGDSFTYAITSDPSNKFEIIGNEVRVKSGQTIDYETDSSFDITVQVTDAGGNTYSEVITINVQDYEGSYTSGGLHEGITGTSEEDTMVGDAGQNIMVGGDGNDTIDGGAGHDIIEGGAGADTLIGGEGNDTVRYWNNSSGININLGTNTVSGGEADGDTISGFERVIASSHDDIIVGSDDDNTIYAQQGDDTITGGAGDDIIEGASGTDTAIFSGNRTDYTVTYNDASSTYTIVDNRPGSPDGTDSVRNVENFQFADGTFDPATLVNEAPTDIQFTSGNSHASSGVLSLNQDGSMGQYAQVQNFDDFPTDALSIEMVVQGGHTGEDSADMPIFSYAVPGNSDEVSVLILEDGRIEVEIDGTTVQSAAGVGDGFLDGDEHRFSLTWDSATGDLKVYQDGVEIYTDNLSQGGTIDQGGTLILGQEQDSFEGGLASHQQLIGTIDDVRIFNDVRTQSEIANNASAQFADPSSVTGLVSNFTFDTVNDNQVNDAAGSNTMTLEGGATIERFSVNEDAAAGSVVATLNTIDANSGDNHTYTITNDPSNSFEIVGNEIRVKAGHSLDYESQTQYQITVQSTDSGGETISESITIDVTNVFDEGPTNINFTGNGNLAISSSTISAGSVVADVSSVVDADAGDLFSFVLTDNAGGKFSINADTGEISLVAEHDASSVYSDTVTVQVTDAGGNTFSEVLGIQLGTDESIVPGGSGTINTGNYTQTGNGFTVTARNVSGGSHTAASVSNVSSSGGALGVSGSVSDTDSGQNNQLAYDKASGLSEEMIIDFDNDLSSAAISFANLYTSNYGEVGHWKAYHEGILVASGNFTETGAGSGSGTVNINPGAVFDQVVMSAKLQSDGTDGSDYQITSINYNEADVASGDTLAGTSNDDVMYGFNGVDTLNGGAGDDSLYGGDGDDALNGGDGNDTLVGGAGADTLDGGAGIDTVDYSDSKSGVTVLLENTDGSGVGSTYANSAAGGHGGDAEGDSYTSIESVVGSDYNDAVYGSSTGTAAHLGAGDDVFDNADASSGMDYVDGGSGNDQIWTGGGSDWIIGGAGDDNLNGEDGSDMFTFRMGDGNDAMNGGAGVGWTDTIQLQDALGGNDLGTYGTDWTIALTEGSITGSDENSFTLSNDADGTINLSDGSSIQFFDMERIEF